MAYRDVQNHVRLRIRIEMDASWETTTKEKSFKVVIKNDIFIGHVQNYVFYILLPKRKEKQDAVRGASLCFLHLYVHLDVKSSAQMSKEDISERYKTSSGYGFVSFLYTIKCSLVHLTENTPTHKSHQNAYKRHWNCVLRQYLSIFDRPMAF